MRFYSVSIIKLDLGSLRPSISISILTFLSKSMTLRSMKRPRQVKASGNVGCCLLYEHLLMEYLSHDEGDSARICPALWPR